MRDSNTEALRMDLIEDVMPLVKRTYRTREIADCRAIFGISRGGGQALMIGLINNDLFGWIGAMSGAVMERKSMINRAFSEPTKINKQVMLLWLGCGEDEGVVLEMNQEFSNSLSKVGIHHEFYKTRGGHDWNLWRKAFAEFTPRIFRH
jgi:enterochelin esterase family protein